MLPITLLQYCTIQPKTCSMPHKIGDQINYLKSVMHQKINQLYHFAKILTSLPNFSLETLKQ